MNENKQKHYLIYQTTNLVNGKIYVGKHETTNIEDGYFGSGNLIQAAIKKYGLENFDFKILIDLKNREEMNLLEKMVVTEEFCKREDVYNIKIGGDGGWDYVNTSGKAVSLKQQYFRLSLEQRKYLSKKAQATRKKWSVERKNEYKKLCRLNALEWYANHPGYFAGERNPMYGHVYTDETRRKMSINKIGSRNSQYGKMWICNDTTRESIRIMKTDPIPKGWRKGRICKK